MLTLHKVIWIFNIIPIKIRQTVFIFFLAEIEKMPPKNYSKSQWTPNSQNNLEKEEHIWKSPIFDSKAL